MESQSGSSSDDEQPPAPPSSPWRAGVGSEAGPPRASEEVASGSGYGDVQGHARTEKIVVWVQMIQQRTFVSEG
jgi:hypothetical protein